MGLWLFYTSCNRVKSCARNSWNVHQNVFLYLFSFLCCAFVLYVFILCLVPNVLPVSLWIHCPFLFAPFQFSLTFTYRQIFQHLIVLLFLNIKRQKELLTRFINSKTRFMILFFLCLKTCNDICIFYVSKINRVKINIYTKDN